MLFFRDNTEILVSVIKVNPVRLLTAWMNSWSWLKTASHKFCAKRGLQTCQGKPLPSPQAPAEAEEHRASVQHTALGWTPSRAEGGRQKWSCHLCKEQESASCFWLRLSPSTACGFLQALPAGRMPFAQTRLLWVMDGCTGAGRARWQRKFLHPFSLPCHLHSIAEVPPIQLLCCFLPPCLCQQPSFLPCQQKGLCQLLLPSQPSRWCLLEPFLPQTLPTSPQGTWALWASRWGCLQVVLGMGCRFGPCCIWCYHVCGERGLLRVCLQSAVHSQHHCKDI